MVSKKLFKKTHKTKKHRVQRGGDMCDMYLEAFMSARSTISNGSEKIILNKYDLQLILLYLWSNNKITFDELKLNPKTLTSKKEIFSIIKNNSNPNTNINLVSTNEDIQYGAKSLIDWINNDNPRMHLNKIIPAEKKQKLLENIKKKFNLDNNDNLNPKFEPEEANTIQNIFRDIFEPPTRGGLENTNNENGFNKIAQRVMRRSSRHRHSAEAEAETKIKNVEPIFQSLSNIGITPGQKVKHIWFKNWPDHGVPKADDFIILINALYADIYGKGFANTTGTTLIHCSAGVGRTGVVYIVLDLMFKHNIMELKPLLKENSHYGITLDEIISRIIDARTHRNIIVQSPDQLKFICEIFGVENTPGKTWKDIHSKIPKNGTRESSPTTECDAPCNKHKNRYADIKVYDDKRVILHKLPDVECSDYINASVMKPLFGNNVITTQCPISATIEDFHRMIISKGVKRIVMVTNLIEGGREKCADYFAAQPADSKVEITNGESSASLTKRAKSAENPVDIATYNYVVSRDGKIKITRIENEKTRKNTKLPENTNWQIVHPPINRSIGAKARSRSVKPNNNGELPPIPIGVSASRGRKSALRTIGSSNA